jgi:predicted nucleic acid-binding protein
VSIVIDASVALKWVFDEPGTEAALALREEQLIAPTLWLAEAANALWRRVRLGEISSEEGLARMSTLAHAPVASLAFEPVVGRGLELAIELRHPVYDCIYLAFALHYDTHVVTDDHRFFSAANQAGLADRVRPLVP